MIRLLHVADVHLDASFSAFGDLCESRRDAVLEAFCKLPDLASEHDAHAVLIAGDLFDSPQPRNSTVAAVREAVRRTAESGRPVFIVPGNHDSPTAHPHPYRESLGATHVFTAPRFGKPATVITPGGQLHVYGFAYDGAQERDPLGTFERTAADGAHVAVFHAGFQASDRWEASPNTLRVKRDDLRDLEADYIALGDHHRFRSPQGFAADGSVPACYPGSFAAVDLTEEGDRGFVVVELEERGGPRVRRVSSGVSTVVLLGDLDVTDLESDAQVADTIAERVDAEQIPVVRLTGSPRFALDSGVVQEHLRARFGHADVVDASLYFTSGRLDEIAGQDTIAGHVVRLGRERIEAADAGEEARQLADRALRVALRELGVE